MYINEQLKLRIQTASHPHHPYYNDPNDNRQQSLPFTFSVLVKRNPTTFTMQSAHLILAILAAILAFSYGIEEHDILIKDHPEVRSVLSDVSIKGPKPNTKGKPSRHGSVEEIIRCESSNNEIEFCTVPRGKEIVDATVDEDLSSNCVPKKFSWRDRYLVVVRNCKAKFRVVYE